MNNGQAEEEVSVVRMLVTNINNWGRKTTLLLVWWPRIPNCCSKIPTPLISVKVMVSIRPVWRRLQTGRLCCHYANPRPRRSIPSFSPPALLNSQLSFARLTQVDPSSSQHVRFGSAWHSGSCDAIMVEGSWVTTMQAILVRHCAWTKNSAYAWQLKPLRVYFLTWLSVRNTSLN